MGILLFIVGFMLCGFILYSIFVFAVWKVLRNEEICGFDVVLRHKKRTFYGDLYNARPAYRPYYTYTPPYKEHAYSDRAIAISAVEAFDDFLREKGIKIPCADETEEAERTEDNDAALYGSEYSELVDEIEALLK